MKSSAHLEHPQTVYTLLSRYDVSLQDIVALLQTLGEPYADIHLDTILRKEIFEVLSAVFEHDGLAIDYKAIEATRREEERKYMQLSYFFRRHPSYHELAKKNRKAYRALLSECRYEDRGKHRYYYYNDLIRLFKQLQDI